MLAHYEQTVQNAFRETRDALVAGTKTIQVLEASIERARAMQPKLRAVQKQHARGYISIIDLLDIQRRSFWPSSIFPLRARASLTQLLPCAGPWAAGGRKIPMSPSVLNNSAQ